MDNRLQLQGVLKKNDDLFVAGSSGGLPYVNAYCQACVEIVHGPSCTDSSREIEVGRCREDNVAIHARRGGGGTVVLSPGMVITIVVGNRQREDNVHDIFSRIHRAFISVLQAHGGIVLRQRGISDLAIGEKKVLGSSLYLSNSPYVYCYQSVLMVESDVMLLSRYLKHPPKEPDYRNGRAHTDFCTTLKREGYSFTTQETALFLQQYLPEML